MHTSVDLWERPVADEMYMIAGWNQWADAGASSSVLPQYLIDLTDARKIGEIKTTGFYLFQIPGTHHLMRPEIQLEDGYRKDIESRANEFFYAELDGKGLLIFLGEEPHLNPEQYAEAFFDVAEELGVKRIVALGGVYGAMPYDKEREISCIYSLLGMKEDLVDLAVSFSDYEGGATIGAYLIDAAEGRGMEMVDLYAFVPAYDFSELSSLLQTVQIEHDFKAWYDLMRRINHMFGLAIDLTELESQAEDLIVEMDSKIDELEETMPQLNAREYLQVVAEEFTEKPFAPLDDVWERELGDIFENLDD